MGEDDLRQERAKILMITEKCPRNIKMNYENC